MLIFFIYCNWGKFFGEFIVVIYLVFYDWLNYKLKVFKILRNEIENILYFM